MHSCSCKCVFIIIIYFYYYFFFVSKMVMNYIEPHEWITLKGFIIL